MRLTHAILVGCLAIALAGCALRGTPKTAKAVPPPPKPEAAPPPPPPQPLSIPQTNVELPPPQPIDPDALVLMSPPEPLPEPPTPRSPRNTRAAVPSLPKPEVTPPPEPEQRPAIQEIIPEAEQKRLRDSVESRKTEINQILKQVGARRLTSLQKGVVRTIGSFLESCGEAEKRGDWKQADGLAERAQILARELQSGK